MLIKGGIATDDFGTVTFVNDFDFKDVKRFYVVRSHRANQFRGWHGHKKEGKYVFVVRGAANIYWESLELKNDVQYGATVRLSANDPQILYIPPGYANASLNLTKDTQIIYFSTATLEESKNDDYRFPKNRWPI